MITRDEIEATHLRIWPYVRRTPVLEADGVSLKLEFLQATGSFKPRGAFNTLLSRSVPAAGVAAASGGNHGAAVAYAASVLGVRAKIFVPEIAAPLKIDKIRGYGADVHVEGRTYFDALTLCEAHIGSTGALGVHAYDAAETIAGQATVAREWEQGSARLDTVLVAVGGGGLIAGVAAWFAGKTRVIGVEPEGSRALHAALEAGRPVDVEVQSIAADSLGARRVGTLNFAILSETGARVALVSDEAIREAQLALWRKFCIAAEPGGAAAYAALLSGAYRPAKDERVGVLLCGANADPSGLA